MAKPRKRMGQAASELFKGRTGADALAAVTGAAPRAKRRASRRPEPKPEPVREVLTVTTVRLTLAQHEWIRRKALDRAITRGGKPDASVIVRELLDAAMAEAAAK